MRKNRRISGFTMAELLIVVAIIAVLGGVSFIAVQRYDRSMAQLERDSIAKEIFVAAQNHLTMADSQGYPGVTSYGTAGTMTGVDTKPNIYYFDADGFTAAGTSALDLMLPFGSVDETVRGGGSYIIRYQSNPATVLDVFYCVPSGKYSYDLSAGDYEKAMALRGNDKKASRRDSSAFNNAVIGWYGGDVTIDVGEKLVPPEIEVINAERLVVKVKNLNSAVNTKGQEAENEIASLKLIITGVTSKAQAAIELHVSPSGNNSDRYATPIADEYTVVLDDITRANTQFASLEADTTARFQPGEDITVQAVAFSNTTLTNIAYSAEITTNSLFADISETLDTAMIGNIRHLENLDDHISGVTHDGEPLKITKAAQIAFQNVYEVEAEITGDTTDDSVMEDLDWSDFTDAIRRAKDSTEPVKIYDLTSDGNPTEGDCFRPISPSYALAYNGQGHAVSSVVVKYPSNAGIFGAVTGGSISNLEIVDCDITGSGDNGNAGALAGSITGTEVSNVLAHNKPDSTPTTIQATGSAGGLVGLMSGGSVNASAAALYVKGVTDAGGLIGKITANGTDGGSVDHSYAGGHTRDAAYEANKINVSATDNAGGLVGSAGGATIENSYSTCSATGKVVGGLVGEASGKIDNCYATGLVRCTTGEDGAKVDGALEGAFAGSYTGSSATGLYYEIINERLDDTANPYLLPVGNITAAVTGVSALDADTTAYNTFVGAPANWQPAEAYDKAKLDELFGEGKYPLKTVDQLKTIEGGTTGLFVATHYGDWPAPETLVVNTKSTT